MKTLYFIGNGFDINHGLKTKYTDFRDWLKINDFEIYEKILEVYGINESDETEQWWSNFESHLIDFDINDDIDNIINKNQIDYGSDNFHEGDRYDAAMKIENLFTSLINKILEVFDLWVESFKNFIFYNKMTNIDKSATFISFNYTLTLEKLYGIPRQRVYHFHGKIGDNQYILGHGKTDKEIHKKIEKYYAPPKGLSKDEKRDWYSDNYDEALEHAKDSEASILSSYKKDIKSIIKRNNDIYEEMGDLKKIYIYGFSFSDIDNPYLEEAIKHAKNKDLLRFEVSWFKEEEKDRIRKFFYQNNIKKSQISFIRLSDYTVNLIGNLFDYK